MRSYSGRLENDANLLGEGAGMQPLHVGVLAAGRIAAFRATYRPGLWSRAICSTNWMMESRSSTFAMSAKAVASRKACGSAINSAGDFLPGLASEPEGTPSNRRITGIPSAFPI